VSDVQASIALRRAFCWDATGHARTARTVAMGSDVASERGPAGRAMTLNVGNRGVVTVTTV
jgi:hypothetical protein